LLGTWPVDVLGRADPAATPEYLERIQAYMMKALNEAKLNTSWVQPNEEWLTATREFIANLLEPSPKNRFLHTFFPVVEEVARLGAINSLTQTLLKLTAPGVPDIYQGNEIWDFSLVDPDNRRPVDYQRRQAVMAALAESPPAKLMQTWPDGRIKMFLIRQLLRFRREHENMFRRGDYLPLVVSGRLADSCISYARKFEGGWIAVVAPRISSRVGFPPLGENWGDTTVELPENPNLKKIREIFSERELQLESRQLKVSEALSILPFAVVTNV
jgi:(1->4)-alpha-D-glucan 1-alpha-D-glucosylmutase